MILDKAMETLEQKLESKPVQEGNMTRKVEEQTAKIPSIGYLGFAAAAMGASAALAFGFKKKELAHFIGLWAPSILIMGLYNKLVKLEHEQSLVQNPPLKNTRDLNSREKLQNVA